VYLGGGIVALGVAAGDIVAKISKKLIILL
jgi:hypothetical protein